MVSVALANVLGVAMIVPQVLRLYRLRSSAGVSSTWIGVGFAMNVWWVAYGTAESLWGMVPVSVVGALLYSIIGTQLRALDGPRSLIPLWRAGFVTAVVPLSMLILGGWAATGLSLGLIYGVLFAPAAVAAFRSSDLRGVSRATWVMAFGEALIWFFYGRSQADIALIVGGAGGSIMSALILFRLVVTARSTDRRSEPASGAVLASSSS